MARRPRWESLEPPVDFIFMLTRSDRTIDDAEDVVDAVCALGVRHIGFKDIGVSRATLERIVGRIRAHEAVCYLEVVSTTPEAVRTSLFGMIPTATWNFKFQ